MKLKVKSLNSEAFDQAAECLRVLAHPTRLRMIHELSQDRYTVGQLAQLCQIKSHVASEHLRLMQRCRFLSADKVGREVFYKIAEPHVLQILDCIKERFGA